MSGKSARNSVLVIDDDADFRMLVCILGQLRGVPVLEAQDCRQGLKILDREQARIKTILLDYFMPGMDAVTCAARLIGKAGPTVSIVLITAAVDARQRAAELHIDRWVSKPVEPSVLTTLLTQDAVRLPSLS